VHKSRYTFTPLERRRLQSAVVPRSPAGVECSRERIRKAPVLTGFTGIANLNLALSG